jgi:hypothetical protein
MRFAARDTDRVLDIGGDPDHRRRHLHAERRRRPLDYPQSGLVCDISGLAQYQHVSEIRRDFLEQLQPSPTNCRLGVMNPVALPPGYARLDTTPLATGSATLANTIGIVRVSLWSSWISGVLSLRSTSGFIATSSPAWARPRAKSPSPKRDSIRTLPFSFQPSCWSRSLKAASSAWKNGSLAGPPSDRHLVPAGRFRQIQPSL